MKIIAAEMLLIYHRTLVGNVIFYGGRRNATICNLPIDSIRDIRFVLEMDEKKKEISCGSYERPPGNVLIGTEKSKILRRKFNQALCMIFKIK